MIYLGYFNKDHCYLFKFPRYFDENTCCIGRISYKISSNEINDIDKFMKYRNGYIYITNMDNAMGYDFYETYIQALKVAEKYLNLL